MEDFKLGNWLAEGGSSKLRSFSLSKSYSRISWVFTCVGAIESSISGVPLLFSRHGEVIEDKSDPVLSLFNRPNPPDVPSFRSLLSQTFILLGIDGILFWVFKREKGIWTTVSIKKKWQMRPVFKSGSDSSLLGWVELDKYKQQRGTYGYREVLPIRYYNPYDPLSGMAPLTAARLGIEQEFNMSAWNASFFARGLRNPIGIKFKRGLLPKQRKELEKNTRDYFSGIEGGQGVFILEGDGEFSDLHLSSTKDLDFVDGKQLTREEICAVYGVPPAVVGIFRYANYANSGIQRTLFWENCLLPKMATLLDLVQTNVLDEEFSGVTAAWDKRGISALQKGFKAVSAAAKTYFDIGYTRSEIAYILDVPELDPPRNESDTEPDIPEEEESQLIIDISKALVPCKTDLDIITIKADEPWWFEYGSAYIQVLTSLENRWLAYLKRYFAELSKSLYKKALRRETPLLNPLVWEASWEGMAELLIGDTCELAAKLTIAELNTAGNLDLILRVIQNTLAKASAVDAIDISKYFTSDELTAFQKAISSYASKTVGVSGEIISELNKRAAQELLTGMTPAQLRKVVGTIVEETYRSRSLTIARTISGGAYNSARFESFQILDVQKHKWINSGDGNVRMTHLQEGGSAPVIVGEPFPVTGCRYPLDPMGKAKEVINCRCTTFPIRYKAPGRTRPVTVPEKPAMTPMVGMGKDQVMKNFFDKMRKHPGLVRRGRYLKVPVKAVKEVEAIADDLLDSDFFKPLQLTDAQVEARVKLYGSRIKVDLPKLDSAGQDELKKYLLGFIDEDTLKAGKVKKVRVCVNDKVPTAVYDVNANRISLSTSMEDRLSLVFNELGKGGNPARKMAPFEDLYLDDLRNLAHEFGHHLHENSKVALDWSKDFFAVRTKKDKFITLRGGAKVKKDKWTSHYQGRVYPEEGSIGGGLELVSMYTAEISALPWTPAMRELLKNPRIRKVWAQTVLANFLGDPDGFEAALKLLGSL